MEKEKSLNLSDLDKLYKPDKELADLYIGMNNKGEEIIFKVAQAGNPLHEKIQRKYAKKTEKYRRFPEKLKTVYEEIVGISLLKDLGKLRDDDGKIVESISKNRIMILHQYPSIMTSVLDVATDINNYIDIPEEEAAPSVDGDDGEEDILTEKEDTAKNLKK